MVSQYHDRSNAEQPRERQVGEALATRSAQPQDVEHASHAGPELDDQVERVRWVMRREPMRERGRHSPLTLPF